MKTKHRRKALAFILTITLVVCYIPITATADTGGGAFKDMPQEGFWSTAALQAAVNNGLLNGFVEKDGTYIKPNDPLTRAQMATIVNRAFGAETKATLTGVADVASNAWYTADMQKAVQMGTMKLDTLMRPNDSITRQEAFTILARAFKMIDGTATDLAGFSDGSQVASWALPGMGALVKAGYVQGSDNMLTPTAHMTRAQFAVIMNNMIQGYITQAGTVTSVANGNVMVNVPGVTLKDLTIQGDLIVGDGVGDGNITLENVTIKGDLIARGGGVNSIIIVGGGVDGKIVIAKVDGQIRVSVEGGAQVEVIVIDDGKDDVIIEGTVGTVEVTAPDTPIIVQNATVTNIEIKSEGAANVTVASNSTVTNVVVGTGSTGTTLNVEGTVTNVETSAANTNVGGTGTVTTVTTNEGANNTSVTTPSTKVNNDGATGVTAGGGTEVPSGSTATNSNTGNDATVQPITGGTTGGGGSTLANISVTGPCAVNARTITFSSIELDQLLFDGDPIALTGTTAPYAVYSSDTGIYTISLSESSPLEVGDNTLTLKKSGYLDTSKTVNVKVLNASNGAIFAEIQPAIDGASAGNEIQVAAGTFDLSTPIVVDVGVTLTGNIQNPEEVILNAPTSGDDREIFQIQSDDVTIQGFTIKGAKDVQKGESWNSNPGVAVGGDKLMTVTKPAIAIEFTFNYWGYSVENIVISNNIITDNSYGIFLFHAQNVTIENNEIFGNTRDANTWSGKGIAIYTSKDMADSELVVTGPALPATQNITINDNQIYNNKLFGIELNHSEAYHGGDEGPFNVAITITNNTIYGNGGPLDALGGALDYYRGISANGNETNVTVSGNAIYGHIATASSRFSSANAGIRMRDSSGWTIQNNEIYGNMRGVYAYGTSNNISLIGNEIYDNGQGIVGANGTTAAITTGNKIYDNDVATWQGNGITPMAIYNMGTISWNAVNNWWGSINGPGAGNANTVGNHVDYDPWYTNEGLTTTGSAIVSDADVNINSGSVVFEYAFYNGDVEITYADALEEPYNLDTSASYVMLTNGTSSSAAVSIGGLGLQSDGSISYPSTGAVNAVFGDINFVPTAVYLSLEGESASWDLAVMVELDADEVSLLIPVGDMALSMIQGSGNPYYYVNYCTTASGMSGFEPASNPIYFHSTSGITTGSSISDFLSYLILPYGLVYGTDYVIVNATETMGYGDFNGWISSWAEIQANANPEEEALGDDPLLLIRSEVPASPGTYYLRGYHIGPLTG